MPIYASDGSLLATVSDGVTRGAYAPDGSQNVTIVNMPPTYATFYGVVANTGTDQGTALRRALKVAQDNKFSLRLPAGVINVGVDLADADAVLRIDRLMALEGDSRGTVIQPMASVGTRAVILIKPLTNGGGIRGLTVKNLSIGTLGVTRNGGDGIKVDTTNTNGFVAKLLVENVGVANAGAGFYSFIHINTQAANATGGMFAATIRDNDFFGGTKFVVTGDSNNIERNIITGPNEGIYYEPTVGAATHRIVGNNITAAGDTIYIKGGQQIKILENQLESIGTYTGVQALPATITCDGAVDVVIRDNNINCYATRDAVAAINSSRGVRVEPNTVTYAADHFLFRAVAAPGNLVERQITETAGGSSVVGRSLVSIDAASWTMGVWQQLPLLNGWTEAADANYRNGLWWMPLPDGTVRLAGQVLYNATNPTLPIANFPATFRISGKAQRLMVLGNNNGVYGAYVIVLDLAGNILGEGVKPNVFYQFDNASFSTRPQ